MRVRDGALVVGLMLAVTGCGQKKIAECAALVKVINAGVVTLEKAPKIESTPAGVADLRAMAEMMDKIGADAHALQLTLPEVRKVRDDYQKMAKEIAKNQRELASATQEKDKARSTAAQSALEAAVKLEDPLVDTLNKFCQSP